MKKQIVLTGLLITCLLACTKTHTSAVIINLPILTTNSTVSITQTTAESGGNISNDGGSTITIHGVCWYIKHNPTTDNYNTMGGAGSGNFTSLINGLVPNTTYYVRAYATNSLGTSYGNEISFHSQK